MILADKKRCVVLLLENVILKENTINTFSFLFKQNHLNNTIFYRLVDLTFAMHMKVYVCTDTYRTIMIQKLEKEQHC